MSLSNVVDERIEDAGPTSQGLAAIVHGKAIEPILRQVRIALDVQVHAGEIYVTCQRECLSVQRSTSYDEHFSLRIQRPEFICQLNGVLQ